MLYKSILLQYRKGLEGLFSPQSDLFMSMMPGDEDLLAFRRKSIADISAAQVFLMDGPAANYADSLRESVVDYQFNAEGAQRMGSHMADISLPSDLVWVEHDHRQMVSDRLKRGHITDDGTAALKDFGMRGFLIDNRGPENLKVILYMTDGRGVIIDPFVSLLYEKDAEGRINYGAYRPEPVAHTLQLFNMGGASDLQITQLLDEARNNTSYDLAMPYMLFALLDSKDNGLTLSEGRSMTDKEARTARKFGKTWVSETFRTHNVVRIGPEAEAHLKEMSHRKAFEASESRRTIAERSAPVEHWVSQHERRYKSGKIVMVSAHKRGLKPDPTLPTLVMGPEEDDGPSM